MTPLLPLTTVTLQEARRRWVTTAGGVAAAATLLVVASTRSARLRRSMSRVASQVFSVAGFVANAAWDLATHGFTKRTTLWERSLRRMEEYLVQSGIADDLEQALSSRKFLSHVGLLRRVQETLPSLCETLPYKSTSSSAGGGGGGGALSLTLPSMEEAARIMRYATAVYGYPMIRSVELELDPNHHFDSSATERETLLQHIQIPSPDDLWIDDSLSYGSGQDSLRHFLAVDHKHRCLVLAIRGTYDLSGAVVDLMAFTEPFCGGCAHAGMADKARALVTTLEQHDHDTSSSSSSSSLNAKLEALPDDYELIITGHSLGAGVACLTTILLIREQLLPPHVKVRCLAFAPPPVFAPLQGETARLVQQHITAYVHARDIVPSLSIHSFRHLLVQVNAIEQASHGNNKMTWWDMVRVRWNWTRVPDAVVHAVLVARVAPMQELDGAPMLVIPAAHIVWLQEEECDGVGGNGDDKKDDEEEKCFRPVLCNPMSFARSGMYVHPNMITDHFPPMYQLALEYLKNEEKKEEKGDAPC